MPGPDDIPGHVLRDCAEELTDIFTDIFNAWLSQAVVPICLKATTIILVPKKPSPTCVNDDHPVTLTPIIIKCFEWLVMHHIKSTPSRHCTPTKLHIGPTMQPTMQPPLASAQPSPTWRRKTCTSECCSLTSVRHPQTSLAGLSDGETTGSSGPTPSR